jgi:predicted ATPase
VQDAAYGALLREPRRALHARIAGTLESQFTEITENQPELLASHYTEAGLIENAAGLWGKAGQRSLERLALVEATEQLTRALHQIETLPSTSALRREQIKLQVALANALMHVKGHASPTAKAALDRARLYVEQAEALGEPLEDPLTLFSVLYGFWGATLHAFNGDAVLELAEQFLTLAEKQGAAAPLMMGHRVMGISLLRMGDFAKSQAHLDRAIALCGPTEHRSLLSRRSMTRWYLGYPEAALIDANQALKNARKRGHSVSLLQVLVDTASLFILCGNYKKADLQADELIALADEKGALTWKIGGMFVRGRILGLTGRASDAVQMITAALNAQRPTGGTLGEPGFLTILAHAYAQLGQFNNAGCRIGEAMTAVETTKEKLAEAEVYRIAGEIALKSPEPDAAKAEAYFDRALAVARQQQAKSWELRAAMSMARLWRDQGKRDEARDLLAPVYGWFTEGFDTLDLKEAKALLDTLAS